MQLSACFLKFIIILFLAGCASSSYQNEEDRLLRAAERLSAKGNKEMAIAVYTQILEKTKTKGPVLLALAKTHLEARNLEAAKKTYETAIALGDQTQAKKGLARCYVLAGRPQIALSLYKEILPLYADGDIYTGVGISYSLLWDHKTAQSFFKKALKQNPQNPDYINNLALSLGSSGQTKEAIALLKPLASPVYAPEKYKNNLATLYELDGQRYQARNLFLQTVGPTGADMNLQALQRSASHPAHFNHPAFKR